MKIYCDCCNCECEPENMYRTIYGYFCVRCFEKMNKKEEPDIINKNCVWHDYDECACEEYCNQYGEFRCKNCENYIERK